MHPVDEQLPMWHLVAHLEHEALEEWRKQHRPSLTLEGSMAQAINAVETTVQRRPGGNVSVTVAITARKAFECEVQAFSLQRAANRLFKRVEPASTSE